MPSAVVQFTQDGLLAQNRKAIAPLTASYLVDPHNAPLHFHPQRLRHVRKLRNGNPEGDLRSFWRTGTRKHKGPQLAKVITAPFTLLVNTVGIPPPEDDRYIQRETHSFPPHECALSAGLNHGSRVLQIRPNALHDFRKQSTHSSAGTQEAECPLKGGAVVLKPRRVLSTGRKGHFARDAVKRFVPLEG